MSSPSDSWFGFQPKDARDPCHVLKMRSSPLGRFFTAQHNIRSLLTVKPRANYNVCVFFTDFLLDACSDPS